MSITLSDIQHYVNDLDALQPANAETIIQHFSFTERPTIIITEGQIVNWSTLLKLLNMVTQYDILIQIEHAIEDAIELHQNDQLKSLANTMIHIVNGLDSNRAFHSNDALTLYPKPIHADTGDFTGINMLTNNDLAQQLKTLNETITKNFHFEN